MAPSPCPHSCFCNQFSTLQGATRLSFPALMTCDSVFFYSTLAMWNLQFVTLECIGAPITTRFPLHHRTVPAMLQAAKRLSSMILGKGETTVSNARVGRRTKGYFAIRARLYHLPPSARAGDILLSLRRPAGSIHHPANI